MHDGISSSALARYGTTQTSFELDLHVSRRGMAGSPVSKPQIDTLFAGLLAGRDFFGPDKIAVEDSEGQKLSYSRLVLASLILGRRLCKGSRQGEAIGILLPNVSGFLITLFGLNAFGRVAAILNYTSGSRNLTSAAQTALIRTVVTSRRFVEMAKLEPVIEAISETRTGSGQMVRIVYLEDVKKSIGLFDKALGAMRSLYAGWFHQGQGSGPSKAAAVLFTSGTEGLPKGVVLTNANLMANSRQMFAHADGALSTADVVLNPLPMFHSFGLTAATLMPLLHGLKVVLYPNPLQYRQVARAIHASRATVLMATDTFLLGYARAAEPGELDSIRLVVAGAEPVKEETRRRWAAFGTEILEGYGATECAPVIAFNVPATNRFGTVGRALPEIETNLVPVPGLADGGRLRIRGPNVMAGYLAAENPGVVVPPEGGWHDTGDIVRIDDDGFISIQGRARRFAKIGGEMVSLAAIELLAQGLWPESQHVVVSLADVRKGEQLVLVTDARESSAEKLRACAREQGFPELWVPKMILVVPAIPVLATGKVDLPATIAMVHQWRDVS